MVEESNFLVSAPGKIIISGEHSVVYGKPALLAAVDRRLFVKIRGIEKGIKIIADEPEDLAQYAFQKTKEALNKKIKGGLKIKISSQIPVARGMGSSAALAVAMVGALFRYFKEPWDKNLINRIAYQIEKKQHGNPSGCDNSIACFGGFLWFQKRGESFKIRPLKIDFRLPEFVLLDSGRAKETTGEMVALVNEKFKVQKAETGRILDSLGRVTEKTASCFKKANFALLPVLIRENERLLEELGVVGKKAGKIIRKIEKLGGAAKICGAGGIKQGSGVILCYHQEAKVILDFAKKQKLTYFPVKLGVQGVRDEKN